MSNTFRLSRKETFSVSIVIFIGFFYLSSLVSALFQTHSIPTTRLFGATEMKFLVLGLFYWSGAIAFFRIRNGGWVICTATSLNFVVVVFQFVVAVSQSQKFDGFAAIIVASFLLVVAGFLFLFSKETRNKFTVSNKSYLFVICVYGVLLVATFLV